MEKPTTRPALTVIEGDGPLPDHHPLKWLLRPCLAVVWDREAQGSTSRREAGKISV